MSSAFELAGLVTHMIVLAIGIGGVAGVVPLAQGRRSGTGLLLMAASMVVLVVAPRWQLGGWAAAYTAGFLAALWLLLVPKRR